ncbi:DNA polymerase III subunit gamma/tau [uncultured Lamprocystis sp.]|jgi:DNA polymerase-3 subunit gamma/tau|uniref:DNA polymerase III subunit gamma/tau n=1 Tax=uncultured Lamprocystis sp. TaxID=543132 RepID=UPI0025CD3980|nr:DNA polymerase III subunit gamma/tau [uncultured Lamprocystis sp.]
MTYQVLARKWRPKSFADMVGQQHVVRALSNALDRDQLHHAYLFTGTRGVGKTTLARILSKALNCEQGVSSTPCGVCASCREVDGGRFVDLLEVDAASRTKVDQTRELLENVPYAPACGRYKVYLIDEVHMFSNSSFNALLKTLEEPPPHVKFLLATTDPQKVPATVLSRCLQFNLRRLLPEEIRARLQFVLETEGLAFETGALALLARAADGSMRDGLSLLDQAIAYGGGRVIETEVRAMLGSVGGDLAFNLLEALADADGERVLAEVDRFGALTPDFSEVLRELIGLLHRLALFQQVPGTVPADDPERARIADLADRLDPADLQLYYQVALTGQPDLALAPDPRAGLEMVLLRALAFRPAEGAVRPAAAPARPAGPSRAPAPGASPAAGSVSPAAADEPVIQPPGDRGGPRSAARPVNPALGPAPLACTADWHALVDRLGVGGIASQLAHHCGFIGLGEGRLTLNLDPTAEQLRSPGTEERLRAALESVLGGPLRLEIQVVRPNDETPAQRRTREQDERVQSAQTALAADPAATRLRDQFDGQWVPGSIEPLD